MTDPVKEDVWTTPDWKEVAKVAGTLPTSPPPLAKSTGMDWKAIKQASDKQFPITQPLPSTSSFKAPTGPSEGFNMATYNEKLTAVESGGNNNAKAETSSATGPHQFIDSTWNSMVKKLGLDYTLADRTDLKKSSKVLEGFTKENVETAKKDLGRTPTMAEAYMYHFVGSSAPKLIQAPPDKPAKDYITSAQYAANKAVFAGKTVGEVLSKYQRKFK